ncbi:VanZ-like transposon protein [Clostridioides difficile]|uniref:Putative VanZ-like transposon protein n=1 Tax=Clostridioides difficile TaxID=1496 RepID=A0A069ASB1_CLODI|nr:VanZ family protein [Clostridioides difficile]MCG7708561.1 VanZ family protein [Clostridioides difficile]MCI2364731.1 VanZ family protein [Clostridioides difficile]MCI4872411.1 VanZ family protein [Clostridioides difficile]MDM9883223.1 VanZ family protein [Clostridioides difficile]MDW0058149.1 VanZ family protein [Clostridioides difficile]
MIWTFYSFICVILPCLIYQIVVIKRKNLKVEKNVMIHLVWVYIFLLYIYLALSKAGIGSIWDIGRYSGLFRIDEINLIPFDSVGILTYILNIIMFMPLGFLLPLIWKNFRNIINVSLTGLGFSLAIELCQLFNLRATDIDDLMMNTLGAVLGYFIWVGVNNLFNLIKKKDIFPSIYKNIIQDEIAITIDDDISKKNYLSLQK